MQVASGALGDWGLTLVGEDEFHKDISRELSNIDADVTNANMAKKWFKVGFGNKMESMNDSLFV